VRSTPPIYSSGLGVSEACLGKKSVELAQLCWLPSSCILRQPNVGRPSNYIRLCLTS